MLAAFLALLSGLYGYQYGYHGRAEGRRDARNPRISAASPVPTNIMSDEEGR